MCLGLIQQMEKETRPIFRANEENSAIIRQFTWMFEHGMVIDKAWLMQWSTDLLISCCLKQFSYLFAILFHIFSLSFQFLSLAGVFISFVRRQNFSPWIFYPLNFFSFSRMFHFALFIFHFSTESQRKKSFASCHLSAVRHRKARGNAESAQNNRRARRQILFELNKLRMATNLARQNDLSGKISAVRWMTKFS